MILALALAVLGQSNEDLLRQVDPDRIKSTIAELVKTPNRNTNNATLDLGADYLEAEYRKIPGLKVERMHYLAQAMARVPVDKEVVEIVATLPGEDDHRIIIGGHFDTINMKVRDLNAVARGADDDSSGTALALECARVMSQRKWKHTLVFVAFSGEEQGLLGSAALAARARKEDWKIDAVLSNDIVGESRNSQGQSDGRHVRVFSEDPQDQLTKSNTTGRTHNSRELARFIEWNSRRKVRGFEPKLVFRRDRFQRGGDHTSFNNEGYTAVRFTEVFEDFTHQHSDQDLPEFLDYNYIANVTRVNLLTAATLANAGETPTAVRYDRPQAHDTGLTWTGKPSVEYAVYWRETQSPVWQGYRVVGAVSKAEIKGVNKDDCIFAVGAIGGVPVEAR